MQTLLSYTPGGGTAYLMQNLNRQTEATVDAVTGEVELFEPRRRAINRVFVAGGESLPDRHGVLAMTTSYGVELLYYEQVRDNNTLINVQRIFMQFSLLKLCTPSLMNARNIYLD